MMRSGGTPNFSLTPCGESFSLDIVLTHSTRSLTSWVKSLSPVEMTESQPRVSARRTSVPITSSASTPSTTTIGQPSAFTVSSSGSICAARSSGIAWRVALYCG